MKYVIRNVEQLRRTQEALGHAELALAYLREDMLPVNPREFVLMAEGLIDEIEKLRAEINAYLGMTPGGGDSSATVESSEIHMTR